MKRSKRMGALLLAAALTVGLLPAYAADSGTIEIATVKQLSELSRSCTLDTWSQGKTVVLTADLDLTGEDFEPIPTFGGVFDGGGHTISGLTITRSGSQQGLFRYVQQGAAVRNLNVSGRIAPAGSAGSVGGIVGCNRGTLSGCTFDGTVSGKMNVGGIAGTNEGTGEIISCSAVGSVSGEHYTGGIAGQNLGAAVSCENQAQVNTREEELSVSIEEWNWEDVNSTENFRAHTDTGGITGYSTGILQSCVNYGTVGYPHTGYNVGGIVGRQAGFLDGCRNHGAIYGRKDVGGVVGQLEPYLLLQFSEDSLQKLDGELDTLRGLLRQLGDQASDTGDLIGGRADALTDRLETVRSGAHDVAGWTTDFVDGTTDTVNELSARVTRTLDRLEPVMDDLGSTGDGLGDAFHRVSRVFDNLDDASVWGEDAAEDARDAFDRMGSALTDAQQAARQMRDAVQALRRGAGDQDALEETRLQLEAASEQLRQSLAQVSEAADALAAILKALKENGSLEPGSLPDALTALAEAMRGAASSGNSLIQGIIGLLPGLGGGSGTSGGGILSGIADLRQRIDKSLSLLRDGLGSVSDSVRGLRRAAGNVSDAFDDLRNFAEDADGTLSGMARAFDDLESAMDDASSAAQAMEDLTGELANEPELKMPALDSGYTSTVDSIFGALEDVSDEVGGLRSDLSGSGDRMHGTADAVNDQIGVISDLLMDGYNEALGKRDEEESDLLEDISDTEDGGTEGHTARAVNAGTVEGDVNVGGITGSMAIEYDLDPEDDIMSAGRRSMNFSYQTRAVVTGCRNEGSVTAKKNHAGGIVGRMDLGRVSACEGYGTVESTSGAYVGGIAGASASVIRDCWAKSKLTGEDYVGGIVGLGKDLSGCRALADIEAEGECVGAVAGDADGELTGNTFVAGELGAVDGVSYAGKAEPVAYDALLSNAGLPDEFRAFTVTFLVDGEVLAVESANFGEDLQNIPEIPEREGQFGEWSDDDFTALRANKTVEAVYSPFITVLESEAGEDGRPLLLAEGKFDRQASVVLSPAEDAPADASAEPQRVVIRHGKAGESGGHLIRVLAEEDANAVWLAADGWKKVDSIRDGSYLVFSIDGDEATFCVGREVNAELTLLIAAGIAGLFLIGLMRRHGRRKKGGKPKPKDKSGDVPEKKPKKPKEPAKI